MKAVVSKVSDTHNDAALKQLDVLRRLGISGRAEITFQLSENLREIVISGIRQRHPEYSQRQTVRAILAMTIDKNLLADIAAAYGDCV